MTSNVNIGLLWKLRRVVGNLRQQDIAREVGISTTRYSAIERGDLLPTDLERRLIEPLLPPLPLSEESEENHGRTARPQSCRNPIPRSAAANGAPNRVLRRRGH